MSSYQKREILNMLESGKISAEEAASLLREISIPEPVPVNELKQAGGESAKEKVNSEPLPATFRVRVRNLETGANKVTVNIPMRMLKLGLKLGSRFSPDLEGLNLSEVGDMMSDLKGGMLVEVQDDERNEHVQVYVE